MPIALGACAVLYLASLALQRRLLPGQGADDRRAACTTEQQSKLAQRPDQANWAQSLSLASCSNHAQANFLRGVAALHSFWYEVALDEFRESTTIDPNCMMGYWGEAMAHNHPLWGDPQETEAARKVLAKINDTPKLTSRELAYLQAVKVLYGEGEKPVRDRAYSAAMEKTLPGLPG